MSKYSKDILEEELKNKVAQDWFAVYDTTQIIGKIDFSVAVPQKNGPELFDEPNFLLWAEAKRGVKQDIKASLVQLVLTIGKARTFDRHLPPSFLGAFDAAKIAFIPYNAVLDTFYQNDFNWNVTPSDHETKEFQELYKKIEKLLTKQTLLFNYDDHVEELREFIRKNFKMGKLSMSKIRITKNNFTAIYQKWRKEVMPSILMDWAIAKQNGILDADFFLADILSTEDNASIKDKLFVLLAGDHYVFAREKAAAGYMQSSQAEFMDNGVAHRQFWLRYHRPPRREWWDYMVYRRELLVPQDVRERKGSYFTPACWVELSQQYIAEYLGDDWQDEYYVWDCCAGTGNLLAGLTNKYNIYASTLDKADVDVMKDRILNGANLLESHVFQFDFLNDDLQSEKVPVSLREILNDPEKRKKLVIYINPPYAEASSYGEKSKGGVSSETQMYIKYKPTIGIAIKELFAQFIIRIYKEIPNCILAEFSTLKLLQAPSFDTFRQHFKAKLRSVFIVPANTFDNVKGQFPIGFYIWDTGITEPFASFKADCYDTKGQLVAKKAFTAVSNEAVINRWLNKNYDLTGNVVGYLRFVPNSFQSNTGVFITNQPKESDIREARIAKITVRNLTINAIYLAVRNVIEATWLNDRDQFLFPNDSWQTDYEFQADCLAYTLFHGQNRISGSDGTNHWIPFTEEEVGASERFDSHFMSDFINGKMKQEAAPQTDLFGKAETSCALNGSDSIAFSPEARSVMDAGRELWRYYHSTINFQLSIANSQLVNASFYDIRRHFQGVKVTGKGKEQMNSDSPDEHYTQLITTLRQSLKTLAKKIEPKVYEHGFLKG